MKSWSSDFVAKKDGHRIERSRSVECVSQFPTETKGDGRIRKNNIKTGSGQGVKSFAKKVSCKNCGFMVDLSKNGLSRGRGTEDGNGAGGTITKTTKTVTLPHASYTEYVASVSYKKGAGCPFCYSANFTDLPNSALKISPSRRTAGI